jgi:hypothetical protein
VSAADGEPLSFQAMCADAGVLVRARAVPPADVLEDLLPRLRAHVDAIIPMVAEAAISRPRHDDLRIRASAGIGEAERRLAEQPPADPVRAFGYGQRLARSVVALTMHLAALEAAEEAP